MSFSFVILAISLIGSMVPISPLACMIDTRIGIAADRFTDIFRVHTTVFLSTGTMVYSNPHFSSVFLLNSARKNAQLAETTTCLPFFCWAIARPLSPCCCFRGALPVKIISSGFPPIKSATCLRAASIASRGTSPHSCKQEGFPNDSAGMAASRAVHQVKQVSWPCYPDILFSSLLSFPHPRINNNILLAV